MKRSRVLFIGAALSALALGAWLGMTLAGRSAAPPTIRGTVFPDARAMPEFQLVDHNNEPYTREHTKNQWTLMYFGYTYCPDVCPTTLYELAGADELLASDGEADDVVYTLVSVDPDRDTPERLAQYVPHFGEKFRGATATLDALTALTAPLGIVFARVDGTDTENYLVDHSSAVIVINPDGEFQAVLSAPHKAENMAADIQALKAYHDK